MRTALLKNHSLPYTALACIAVMAMAFSMCSSEQGPAPEDFMSFQTKSAISYDGFAEYNVRMELLSVREEEDGKHYLVRAAVADMSDGESELDFTVDLAYFLTPTSLVQSGQRRPLMDSEFQSIELLRAPIKQGAGWTQQQRDATGKFVDITCRITNLITLEGRTVIDVTYESEGGARYEWRRFGSGLGLVRYEKKGWDENMVGFFLIDTDDQADVQGAAEAQD